MGMGELVGIGLTSVSSKIKGYAIVKSFLGEGKDMTRKQDLKVYTYCPHYELQK
jgi:hypothetical protein